MSTSTLLTYVFADSDGQIRVANAAGKFDDEKMNISIVRYNSSQSGETGMGDDSELVLVPVRSFYNPFLDIAKGIFLCNPENITDNEKKSLRNQFSSMIPNDVSVQLVQEFSLREDGDLVGTGKYMSTGRTTEFLEDLSGKLLKAGIPMVYSRSGEQAGQCEICIEDTGLSACDSVIIMRYFTARLALSSKYEFDVEFSDGFNVIVPSGYFEENSADAIKDALSPFGVELSAGKYVRKCSGNSSPYKTLGEVLSVVAEFRKVAPAPEELESVEEVPDAESLVAEIDSVEVSEDEVVAASEAAAVDPQ
ncbi:MAG: hypothetical protein JKX76_00845 [Colwellia sp.]|nr:hypothetical protein [Colwellia sp.]